MDESTIKQWFSRILGAWRQGLAVILVVFGIAAIVSTTPISSWLSVKTGNNVFGFSHYLSRDRFFQTVGGDVVVPPPVPTPRLPELQGVMIDGVQFTAPSMMVKDRVSGAVLFGKQEYEVRPIASITKLMSALVLLETMTDWTTTTIGASDQVIDVNVLPGETYSVEDLWNAALIASSNRAVLSLVDQSRWSRDAFIERMNQKALELGMTQTAFVEPTGLDANNVSTAADVALLLHEALSQERIRDTVLKSEYTISLPGKKPRHMWSTNWLLLRWVPHTFTEILGGKTGYIDASKYNFTFAVQDDAGHIIDVVVLGAEMHEARFTEAKTIAEWVFANYRWPE